MTHLRAERTSGTTLSCLCIQTQATLERIVVGSAEKDGKITQKYVNAKTLVKDVVFEETHDNSMNVEDDSAPSNGGNTSQGGNTGGNTGGNPGGGGNGDSPIDDD